MSHARCKLAAFILVLLSAAPAAAEPAVVQTKLKLRSGPGPAFSILAVLPSGTKLDAQKCTDEWCRVKLDRLVGYVSRDLLKMAADSYASAVPQAALAPAPPKATLGGPHVWQWNDSAWRDRQWRRLEWHNRLNR
jgi:uncharacterized protein YraI